MENARTEDVKRLYERYPYPYSDGQSEPDPLFTYLFRQYFALHALTGWRILDVGCGTGHKLAGLALAYSRASFVGLELSAASVSIARRLMAWHHLHHVDIQHGDLLTWTPQEPYDIVLAFGVVHHLEDPQRGLSILGQALKDDGILAVWLYHPFGEFVRLRQRELLLTLWGGDRQDMAVGQRLMAQLGLELPASHYGPREQEASALAANADAFMHPIVHAYRFAEARRLLKAAGMSWSAVDFVNLPGAVKLLNLAGVHDPFTGSYCIRTSELFAAPDLQRRYEALSHLEQMAIIEGMLRPRGFQILAGRGEGYRRLAPRLRGNVVWE